MHPLPATRTIISPEAFVTPTSIWEMRPSPFGGEDGILAEDRDTVIARLLGVREHVADRKRQL
jgi:hypothetical protein